MTMPTMTDLVAQLRGPEGERTRAEARQALLALRSRCETITDGQSFNPVEQIRLQVLRRACDAALRTLTGQPL